MDSGVKFTVHFSKERNRIFYHDGVKPTWELGTEHTPNTLGHRLLVLDLSLFIERGHFVPGQERVRRVRNNDDGLSFRSLVSL